MSNEWKDVRYIIDKNNKVHGKLKAITTDSEQLILIDTDDNPYGTKERLSFKLLGPNGIEEPKL